MSTLGLILVIILIVALLGGWQTGGFGYGNGPIGILGVILIVVIVLLLMGRL